MNKLKLHSKKILFSASRLEKKHKIITYASLLFLSISTYFFRSENQNIKINYAMLKEKNANMKYNMIIFNSNYEHLPLPTWQKVKRGKKFIIQYVNPAYVNKFNYLDINDQYAFIGKSNFELFPKNIAQLYYEGDIAVAITGKKRESIENTIDKKGNTFSLKVIKWREIKDNKDTLVYGMIKEILPLKK
jgi:hypothetical protein